MVLSVFYQLSVLLYSIDLGTSIVLANNNIYIEENFKHVKVVSCILNHIHVNSYNCTVSIIICIVLHVHLIMHNFFVT